jgi:hypothetical protein
MIVDENVTDKEIRESNQNAIAIKAEISISE